MSWDEHYKKILDSVDFEAFRNIDKRDPYIKRMLRFSTGKKNSLEFGSGKGGLSLLLKRTRQDIQVNLLDSEQVAVKISKELFRYYRLHGNFFVCSFLDMPFKDECFDFIHGNTVLEHVEDTEKAIEEIFRVLAKNGQLLITVPNKNRKFDHDLYHTIYRLNYFSRTFQMKELTKILESYDCKIIEKFGTGFIYHYPSYIPRYLFEKLINKTPVDDNFEGSNSRDNHDKSVNSKNSSIYSKKERKLYNVTFSYLDNLWDPIQRKLNHFVNNKEILPYQLDITIGVVIQKL